MTVPEWRHYALRNVEDGENLESMLFALAIVLDDRLQEIRDALRALAEQREA